MSNASTVADMAFVRQISYESPRCSAALHAAMSRRYCRRLRASVNSSPATRLARRSCAVLLLCGAAAAGAAAARTGRAAACGAAQAAPQPALARALLWLLAGAALVSRASSVSLSVAARSHSWAAASAAAVGACKVSTYAVPL